MDNHQGLDRVTVDKDALLKQLGINREQHARDYSEAVVEYNKQVVNKLQDNLVRATDHKASEEAFELNWSLTQPRNYLEEYDRVIHMLTMSINPNVTVTQQEFEQYARNKWHWQQAFAHSTQSYLNKKAC